MDDGTETTRTVREDGISVRKTVEEDGDVRIDVESERETAATVRLTDPTLESHPERTIQFHAEYDDWATEDTSSFEGTLDPETSRTIRYRIPNSDPETLETDPQLSVADGSDIDRLVDRARTDALREFVGGDRDSLEPDPAAEPTAESAPDPAAEAALDDDTDDGTTPPADAGSLPDGVARALLNELREGDADESVATELRSELGETGRRSQEVRLDHLQSEVSDLAAYTDTIESFIDRHGTLDSVIEDVRSDLSALEARSDRIESTLEELPETVDRVEEVEDELGSVRSAQSDLESELDELRSAQDDFESELDELRSAQTGFESDVERIDGEIDDIHDRLEEFELFKERLSGVFRDLQAGDSGP